MFCEFYENLKALIAEWSKEAGRSTAYKYDSDKKCITMYTGCPGLFIGLKGELVNKYKKKLCDFLFIDNLEIKFEEVDGVCG